MPLWNSYYFAKSIPDALEALSAPGGNARVIAGGTDLLLDMQQGRHPPVDTLVDITIIPELLALEIRHDHLFIGAAVPLNRIVASSLVWQHAQALAEACQLIGGDQLRNVATLGGNVAHGLPAADGTIALLALDASVEIASQEGHRLLPVKSMFVSPGRTVLDASSELLVGFRIPFIQPYQASAFTRITPQQGVALPIINLAVWIERGAGSDIITDVRLAVGPAGPVPRRTHSAEGILRGSELNPSIVQSACQALLTDVSFRSSPHRASVSYRQHLAAIILEETLNKAWHNIQTHVSH